MFGVANNAVVAPVTTVVLKTPAAGETFSGYASDLKCNNLNTIGTIMAMVRVLANDAGGATATSAQSAQIFRVGAPAAIIALMDAAPAVPPTDDDYAKAAAIANVGNAGNWLLNLISAAKKKPITAENVTGFFAGLGHEGTNANSVASFINSIRGFSPDLVGNAGHRGLLAPGLWTTYRITRASAGAIMFELLGTFRELGITAMGDGTEVAITAARNAPWDLALANMIPVKYKAYAAIFLEAAGTPIDDWVQGNNAIDTLPAVRVRGIKTIFRRYLEVKNDTANIAAINTVAGFQAPAVTNFW